jgi:lipopolysaccharide/colanic/teichoic acid biosynthesis glycosyltransferase
MFTVCSPSPHPANRPRAEVQEEEGGDVHEVGRPTVTGSKFLAALKIFNRQGHALIGWGLCWAAGPPQGIAGRGLDLSEYSSGAERPVTGVNVSDLPVAAREELAPDLELIERVFCPSTRSRAALKRTFDLTVSVALLVLLSPVFATISVVLALHFKRSPIFAHERVGRDGEIFKCLKFRTMRDVGPDEPTERHPAFKDGTDTRTTRLTAWLRRTSLDELPQLLNVFNGEMSIVGPRPVVQEELAMYFRDYAPLLLTVKPGMTGLWTVNGRSDVAYPARMLIELDYVTNMSLKRDIGIVARTVTAVIGGRGAL